VCCTMQCDDSLLTSRTSDPAPGEAALAKPNEDGISRSLYYPAEGSTQVSHGTVHLTWAQQTPGQGGIGGSAHGASSSGAGPCLERGWRAWWGQGPWNHKWTLCPCLVAGRSGRNLLERSDGMRPEKDIRA